MTASRQLALAALLSLSAYASPAAADPVFTALASFSYSDDLSSPPVIDSAGNLYGIDELTAGSGLVYKFSGGALTTLFTFDISTGYYPGDRLVADAAGNLYGTTRAGGPTTNGQSGNGTIFKLTPSGALTTLVSFPNANGVSPGSVFSDAAGNVYATELDGAGATSVFKLAPSGTLTKLLSFTAPAQSTIDLVADTAGNFYGTAYPSAGQEGTVFELTASGTLKTVATVTGVNGAYPMVNLITDAAGNIYVTTTGSGTSNDDTIFKLTPSGTLTPVVTFTGPSSGRQVISLVDAAGNFYGSSTEGAASNPAALGNVGSLISDTIVKLTPSGTLTTLAATTFADGCGVMNVVADAAGNLFGTTQGCYLGGGRLFSAHLFEISDSGFVVAGSPVPEPPTLNMFGLCAAGLVALRRRRSTSRPIQAGGQQN